MTQKRTMAVSSAAVLALGALSLSTALAAEPETPATSELLSPEDISLMLSDYCLMCHSEQGLAGGLNLEDFDAGHLLENAETAEKMIRKLRAGMMPPSYAPQPEADERKALVASLEGPIDEAYAMNPNPGRRTFQRLNRAEYSRSVQEILSLDVDVSAYLPPDTISHGFDNVADVQAMSPTLMEGYLRAASAISRLAVGDPEASATEVTYKVPRTASQMGHVDGAPMGTRGGISVVHNFPADGDYVFKIQLHSTPTGLLYGLTAGNTEQLEVSVNGVRMALLDINPLMTEADPNGMVMTSEPIHIKAGPQRIAAAFIQRFDAPIDDLIAPIEHTLADTTIGRGHGVTALPHLRFLSIGGPFHVTGVSDTPSRRAIFTCRPISPEDEHDCASEILSRLATQAYRRPVSENDVEGLMSFYQAGADEGDFETGIRTGLQAILTNPQFVFRLELVPDGALTEGAYRVGDLELASRLSYFLWAAPPDEELRDVAARGELSKPEVLEAQVDRMLEDPRSEALATRFAAQWLRLADLARLHPNYLQYPQYDHKLAEYLRRETELFFDHLIHEDKSVLEFLTADYTFVNERLAKHYGIPNVTGDEFRRVSYEGDERRGILGHGSVLTLTSVADRTSPVQRGKWIMEVILGTPPPPPPPNVPALEAASEGEEGRLLTVRESMEMHRSNPACMSCHAVIDPLGLALENFDVTGVWRIKDNGWPIDPTGELYDGTPIDGPAGLRQALLDRSDVVLSSFTSSLMTYGLGRRVEAYDMPAVRRIVGAAGDEDYRFSAFIKGVINSSAFQMKSVEDAVETTEAPH